MNFQKHFATLSGLALFISSVAAQQDFTLEQAIEYALEYSNSMKVQELEIQDAHYRIKEYKATGIPQLEGGVNYTYYLKSPAQPTEDFLTPAVYGILFQEGVLEPKDLGSPEVFEFSFFRKQNLSAYLDFNALLFDGVFLQGLKAAKLFKQLTENQVAIARKEIKENVTKSYLAVLIAERNLEIVRQNISNVEINLRETQAFYDNGFAEQLDVDRLQLSLDELMTESENLQKLIELSYNVLKYQMSYPLPLAIKATEELEVVVDLMTLEDPFPKDSLDFHQRPEYDVLNQAIALDEVDVKRLKSGYLPTLKAFASASESIQRDKLFDSSESSLIPNVNVGLGLTVPIFDGNQKSAQIQRTKIRLAKRQIEKEEFERAMQLEVSNAYINLANNRKTLENRQKALRLNENIFEKSQIKYREGVGSSVELRQSESFMYVAQANYINALYDLVISKVNLDIALGKLK